MTPIRNLNIVFRCPDQLKERMQLHAEGRFRSLSDFIRSACLEALRTQSSKSAHTNTPAR